MNVGIDKSLRILRCEKLQYATDTEEKTSVSRQDTVKVGCDDVKFHKRFNYATFDESRTHGILVHFQRQNTALNRAERGNYRYRYYA